MKKTILLTGLVLVFVLSLTFIAMANNSGKADFKITATIAEPISVEAENIDFGTIYNLDENPKAEAEFVVAGQSGETYKVTISDQVELVNSRGDIVIIELNVADNGKLNDDGTESLAVEAVLLAEDVDASTYGDFAGESTVDVVYDY